MSAPNDLILFHYSFSPYARRITWYLTLRGISYAEYPTPHPPLSTLGLAYRRIPVLSHGRSLYCDTRLILQKLDAFFPSSPLATTTPDQRALSTLLSNWTIDGGIFARAAQALPAEMPLMRDEKFQRDREEYTGRSWSQAHVKAMRPEALAQLREAFTFLETSLLADNRRWILNTPQPSLADIEAIWPFHWLLSLKTALPTDLFGEEKYPKLHAWIRRFDIALKDAAQRPGFSVKRLSGEEAIAHVTAASYPEPESVLQVDESDPTGLKRGDLVESWPVDSGMRHRDRGRLIGLGKGECVLRVEREGGGEGRVVHPRWNFRVKAVGEGMGRL